MGCLADHERAQWLFAKDAPHRFPLPTQIVAGDTYADLSNLGYAYIERA